MIKFLRLTSLIVCLGIFSFLGCSSDSGSGDEKTTYQGLLTVGDIVHWELNNTALTFTASNETTNEIITGSFAEKNDHAGLNGMAVGLTGDASRTVRYYEASTMIKNGTSLGDLVVPFVELKGTAMIAYVPDNADETSRNVAIMTPAITPDLTTVSGQAYNFLDVFNPKEPDNNLQYGSYTITSTSSTQGSVAVSVFNLSDDVFDENFTDTVSVSGGKIVAEDDSDSSAIVVPSGVMIIDNGPNDGGKIGAAQFDADNSTIDGLYLVILPNNSTKIILAYINNLNCKWQEYDFETDTAGSTEDGSKGAFNFVNAGDGVFTGNVDDDTKIRMITQGPDGGVFFGAVVTNGTDYDNFIGLRLP